MAIDDSHSREHRPEPVRGDGPSDARLLADARAGSARAFRHLVERYQGLVAGTVIGMLGPGADAEDVGQEVFLRFYRSIDRFRGESALGTYLTRIAINLSLNAIRRRKRLRERFTGDEADHGADLAAPPHRGADRIEAWDVGRTVRRALERLPEDQRSVVILRLVHGYSTRETAELLQVAEGTVTSRLARARATLQSILEPHPEATS